ncbi:gem-associated protein 8-like [Schistocerca serialis cubense]|uniref:gem-associated protein 8-like n=1 Tax=Schistocerca serialis cubense TaxID=2023355 RepID=UPI00214EF9F5|nr:gem-associated protein 8-like [Schistocerca serialis cubense]
MSGAEIVVRVVGKTKQKCKSRKQKRKLKKRRMEIKRRYNASRLLQTGQYCENDWFWQSYQRAVEWQGKHYIAYWRAKCIALQAENRALKDCITKISSSNKNNVQLTSCSSDKDKVTQKDVKRKPKAKPTVPVAVNSENKCTAEETEDYKFEFQLTEEMLDFFEHSMKHRMERDKLRAAKEQKKEKEPDGKSEDDDNLDTVPPKNPVGQQRIEEMKLLYGKAAPMIMGMETALQLSFDRNVDKLQPRMWPNIPLKL